MTDAVDQFEARVSGFNLTFVHGPKADRARMPDLVDIYRDLSDRRIEVVPDPMVFANRVADEGARADPGAWPRNHLMARALITWPSLVRQHHFLLVLRTRYPEDIEAAYWFPWLDHHGIDILAVYQPYAFGLALSLDTDRARFYAAVKQSRHPDLKGILISRIEVNAERHRSLRMANGALLWLHPIEDAELVAGTMRSIRIQAVDKTLLNIAEERLLVDDLKARGVLRKKYGYPSDARPLLAEYRMAVRAKALGFRAMQPELQVGTV